MTNEDQNDGWYQHDLGVFKPPGEWTLDDIQSMGTSALLQSFLDPTQLVTDLLDEIKKNAASPVSTPVAKIHARLDEIKGQITERGRRLLPMLADEINRRIPVPPRPSQYAIHPRWTDPLATAAEVRDSIIGAVGMLATARTVEMQIAYERALAREGKVDSPDGPVFPQDHPSAGERLTPEQAVALARNVINKYSASSDKPSVQLALRVINGAHERDQLRDALREVLGEWSTWVEEIGNDPKAKERIAELTKLLERP